VSVVVGLDTATASTAVAVLTPETQVERRDDPAPGERPRHAERLLALLHQALEEAGAGWGDVSRICVGVGPGGFTGLRLGIATARGLAQGHGVPLVGVSSLEALARGAGGDGPTAAVIDARRGEVFAAAYDGDRTLLEPLAVPPADLVARLTPPLPAVGDGAVRFREELERAGLAVPSDDSPAHRVSALMIARLGRARDPVDRDALLPDYRREPDAVPPPPPS
jgi:tRNA threonylcarbamoyladenosine biosynthesis protein TsaB